MIEIIRQERVHADGTSEPSVLRQDARVEIEAVRPAGASRMPVIIVMLPNEMPNGYM